MDNRKKRDLCKRKGLVFDPLTKRCRQSKKQKKVRRQFEGFWRFKPVEKGLDDKDKYFLREFVKIRNAYKGDLTKQIYFSEEFALEDLQNISVNDEQLLKELVNLYVFTYNPECIYYIKRNICIPIDSEEKQNGIPLYIKALYENIMFTLYNPIELLEYTVLCDNNCKRKELDWSVKLIDRGNNFIFPEYTIKDIGKIFDNYSFYIRTGHFFDENYFYTLFSNFPGLCSITKLIHVYSESFIPEYINSSRKYVSKKYDLVVTNSGISNILFEECNERFTLIPVQLNWKHGAHAVAIILDHEDKQIIPIDPHGGDIVAEDKYGKEQDSLLFRYTRLLQDISKNTYKAIKPHLVCDRQGIQYIEEYWQRIQIKYKPEDAKFLVHRRKEYTGNCYLWILLLLMARLSNPQLTSKQASIKLHEWLQSDDIRPLLLFEKLYQIMKLGKEPVNHDI